MGRARSRRARQRLAPQQPHSRPTLALSGIRILPRGWSLQRSIPLCKSSRECEECSSSCPWNADDFLSSRASLTSSHFRLEAPPWAIGATGTFEGDGPRDFLADMVCVWERIDHHALAGEMSEVAVYFGPEARPPSSQGQDAIDELVMPTAEVMIAVAVRLRVRLPAETGESVRPGRRRPFGCSTLRAARPGILTPRSVAGSSRGHSRGCCGSASGERMEDCHPSQGHPRVTSRDR